MSKISIASPQEIVPLDRRRLREVVRAVLAGEDTTDYEISLAFVDNPTIQRPGQRTVRGSSCAVVALVTTLTPQIR